MKSCALINLFYFESEIINIIEGIMTQRLEGKKTLRRMVNTKTQLVSFEAKGRMSQ